MRPIFPQLISHHYAAKPLIIMNHNTTINSGDRFRYLRDIGDFKAGDVVTVQLFIEMLGWTVAGCVFEANGKFTSIPVQGPDSLTDTSLMERIQDDAEVIAELQAKVATLEQQNRTLTVRSNAWGAVYDLLKSMDPDLFKHNFGEQTQLTACNKIRQLASMAAAAGGASKPADEIKIGEEASNDGHALDEFIERLAKEISKDFGIPGIKVVKFDLK